VKRTIAADAWSPQGIPGLEPTALDVVRSNENHLVVAGPGAGKTEMLAQRASFLLETATCPAPYRILAISFKRDAASNLKERVTRRCGTDLARRFESYTFDAWAKSALDRFRLALPHEYRPTSNYLIDFRLADEARLQARLLSLTTISGVDEDKIYRLNTVSFYRKYVANLPIDLDTPTKAGTALSLIRALWQQVLFAGGRSVLDFQMIGALAELILRANPKLLSALRITYRYVFLDEFQDTTRNQFNLLMTAFGGSRSCITAVGDNKQRIMLWAGAKVDVFEAFQETFGVKRCTLRTNYRSAPRLIAIQNRLIEEIDPEADAAMVAPEGTPDGGECRILTFDDDDAESVRIAELVNQWINIDKVSAEEICVLVRQRSDLFAAVLKPEFAKYGIALRVQDALQDLLSEPLTQVLVNALSVCCKSPVPVQWCQLREVLFELRGLTEESVRSRKAVESLATFIQTMRPKLEACAEQRDLIALFKELLAFLGKSSFCLRHERYLQNDFFAKIMNDCAAGLIDARSRTGSWVGALDDFLGVGYVPVMSIHKSKGLEYHSVILLGLEDYPFRGLTDKTGEEECNVFVAFSRAKQRVLITSVDERGGRRQTHTEVAKFFGVFAKAGVHPETL
jgi:superfamily I DNA/RNA helicase